jgi:hypothetical protein
MVIKQRGPIEAGFGTVFFRQNSLCTLRRRATQGATVFSLCVASLVTIRAWPKENVALIFLTKYSYAWFVGLAAVFLVYRLARSLKKN